MKKNGRNKKSTSSKNKKIKNATPLTYDGIKFRSKLEVYCYKQLKKHNINIEYESITFTILESFKYKNKTIRKMTYTPDFIGDNFIIECKGYMNDAFPLRWKLFKYFLYKNKMEIDLYLPRNQTEVDKMVLEIIKLRNAQQ